MMIPVPLAAAFEKKSTISSAELCELLPMDDGTLRQHVRAGNIEFIRLGLGVSAPRRFTLEAVMAFLEERREREAPAVGLPREVGSRASGGAFSAIRARLEQRNAEKLKERAARQKAEAGADRGVPARRAKVVAEARGQPSSAQARN